MYVCLCSVVTDHDIKKRKEAHPSESFKECCDKLKIGKGCGLCKREANKCYKEAQGTPPKK